MPAALEMAISQTRGRPFARPTPRPVAASRGRSPRWAVGMIVALGLGLRLFHYLRNPTMWHDEAALVLNVIGKTFRELLGPLYWSEAAPPLFLWVERGVALTLGDGTLALRLLPFVASMGALVCLVPLARRALSHSAVPWAVLLISCSDRLLWHACEAKPYAVDVFAAALLPYLYCLTRDWRAARRFGVFTVLAPAVILLSFPGCFLYGGLLVAVLPEICKRPPGGTGSREGRRAVVAYGILAATVMASFAYLLLGPIRAQRCDPLHECWQATFPRWDRPWTVPGWAVWSSVEIVDYCFRPAGAALAFLVVIGGVRLWRRGDRPLVCLLTLPIGLALTASLGKAYPYTGARVMAYASPALALFIAEGGAAMLRRLRESCQRNRSRIAPRAGLVLLIAGLLAPLGFSLYRLAVAWPRPDFIAAAEYVLAHRRPGDCFAGNSWESLYYFRGQGTALVPLGQRVAADAGRAWVVVTGSLPSEAKLQIARDITPPGWQTREQRTFPNILVVLQANPGEMTNDGTPNDKVMTNVD